jgi:hypothetical protein
MARVDIINKKAKKRKIRKIAAKRKKRGYDNPSLAQAMKREDWPEWEKAINLEYQQMTDDGVFEKHKGKLPPGANLIGSMMTLTIKRNQDGSIDKYKARLVCLGNQQEESSYDAIKSGTARSATVKLMISIQAKLGCSSMVLDVKGAYLKSKIREELNEKLFIMLPDKSVVRLKKYLYGLKQAGYEWEQNVTKCLIRGGYDQSEADPRSFSKWDGDRFVIMCIHVDDFFVIGSDPDMLHGLFELLESEYGQVSIKEGDLLAYLGMQISVDPTTGSISLTQPAYTNKLLELHLPEGNKKGKTYRTPMSTVERTMPEDTAPIDQRGYLEIVGGLNYLAQYTRPDILYALSILAQKCANPTVGDKKKAIRILRYLESTVGQGLNFSPGPIDLQCFVDAAHHSYSDGKGHYGYSFSLGAQDGCFFAKSKKMKLVTLSSTESEYVALCEAAREAMWLRRLLQDIGFKQKEPTIMWQDNKSTIDMVNGHRNFQSSKHINPKFHYTGDMVEQGELCLEYKPTGDMVADVLTKALPARTHIRLSEILLNSKLKSIRTVQARSKVPMYF